MKDEIIFNKEEHIRNEFKMKDGKLYVVSVYEINATKGVFREATKEEIERWKAEQAIRVSGTDPRTGRPKV